MKHTFIITALYLFLLISLPIGLHAQSFGASAPEAGFQSTSSMASSGSSLSSEPSINASGYAADPYSAAPSASGRVLRTMDNPPDEDDDPNPIGDAVLPLLLLAAGYCAFSSLRRRKEA